MTNDVYSDVFRDDTIRDSKPAATARILSTMAHLGHMFELGPYQPRQKIYNLLH